LAKSCCGQLPLLEQHEKIKRKRKKTRILPYSGLPTGIYFENLAIFILNFFCKSGEFGFFFPLKNHLYKSQSYFSGRNLAKFLQKKKIIWPITNLRPRG